MVNSGIQFLPSQLAGGVNYFLLLLRKTDFAEEGKSVKIEFVHMLPWCESQLQQQQHQSVGGWVGPTAKKLNRRQTGGKLVVAAGCCHGNRLLMYMVKGESWSAIVRHNHNGNGSYGKLPLLDDCRNTPVAIGLSPQPRTLGKLDSACERSR